MHYSKLSEKVKLLYSFSCFPKLFRYFYGFCYVNLSSYSKRNHLHFRHFRQFSILQFVIYSTMPSNPPQNCYQIENFRVCGIMEPIFCYPQPLFSSTGVLFDRPESPLSPTGRKRLPSRLYDPLPIFTIFHPNMRHSFS